MVLFFQRRWGTRGGLARLVELGSFLFLLGTYILRSKCRSFGECSGQGSDLGRTGKRYVVVVDFREEGAERVMVEL